MGTWGMGVFDSDNSREFLDSLVEELVAKICKLLPLAMSYDFLLYGEQAIIPAIDILLTLSSHYRIWLRIESSEAKSWKKPISKSLIKRCEVSIWKKILLN